MTTGTLAVFCGKMASGKSTLARQIAQERAWILMSEDVLLASLYPGEITDVPGYVRYSSRLKSAMRPLLLDLLRKGTSVVLDFPANTRQQRQWIRELAMDADAPHEFHFLDCSDAICKARLQTRAVAEPERQATDTEAMFDAITRYFEPPSTDEGFDIIRHQVSDLQAGARQ